MNSLTNRQLDFLSAALRHVADAELLLHPNQGRLDQAWHLAGFGPECVRKACLEDAILDRPLGHDLGRDSDKLLEWWLGLDTGAWRYDLRDWAQNHPKLAEWRPDARYERTGHRQSTPVSELTRSARELVDTIVADLWTDGRLKPSFI